MVAEFTKQAAGDARARYTKSRTDDYRDPELAPTDVVALQHNLDAMRELGFLKTNIDAAKHSDLSYIDDAVRRLK